MNNYAAIGRLTAQPEIRYTKESNKAVCNFSIAVRKFNGDPLFIDCKAWGKTAEFIGEHFSKGTNIGLTGSMDSESWEKDGVKHEKKFIQVESVSFADSKKSA